MFFGLPGYQGGDGDFRSWQAYVVGGSFASPVWDSGEVLSKLGNIDTARHRWRTDAEGLAVLAPLTAGARSAWRLLRPSTGTKPPARR